MTSKECYGQLAIERRSTRLVAPNRADGPLALTMAVAIAVAACSGESEQACSEQAPTFAIAAEVITANVGSTVAVEVTGEPACQFEGSPIAASVAVLVGGGSVDKPTVDVSADGAKLTWTLGPAPIRQSLGLADTPLSTALTAFVTTPVVPTPFADVHKWMSENNLDSTTEDLAIRADGTVVLGIDAGLLELKTDKNGETSISHVKPTGDKLLRAHGIAYDRKGLLWIADPTTPAVHAMTPEGVVTTHLKDNGSEPLMAPNYVAVAPQDRVVVSDPCLGELLMYDPPTKKVTDIASFDLKTEGGPNGFAYDKDNKWLYVVTMNTGLLCPSAKVKPNVTDNIASLFRFNTLGTKFGKRETIETGFGLFGDGMAFD
jgi:hypothetical protein